MKRPEGGSRDAALDVARGLAALVVVSVHVVPDGAYDHGQRPAYMWFEPNIVGVSIFFVLSGYLVAAPWLRGLAGTAPFPSAKDYVRRRLARILPAYWLALAAAYFIEPSSTRVPLSTVAEHVFFYQIYIPREFLTLLIVSWTLSVEVSFYLLLPIVSIAVRRLRRGRLVPVATLRRWLLGIAIVDLVAYEVMFVLLAHLPQALTLAMVQSLGCYLSCFALGAYVALTPEVIARLRVGPALIAAGVTAAFATQANYLWPHHLWGQPILLLPSALVVCAALALREPGPRTHRVLVLLTPLGTYSYGIYLFHLSVLNALLRWAPDTERHLLPPWSWPLRVAVLVLLTIPFAVVSWYGIESPALRWAARKGRSERAAALEGWRAARV